MQDMNLPMWCETQVASIMSKQEIHGVNFDKRKASFLVHQLTEEILKVDLEAVPQLPKMKNVADAYKKPFLKSGKLAHWPKLYCEAHGIPEEWVGGPFSRVWYTDFDMGKTDLVKRVLIDHGWKPTEWNTKKLVGLDNAAEWVDNYITKNLVEDKSANFKDLRLKEMNYNGVRNRKSLAKFMLNQRYIPTSPKITEDSLKSVSGSVGGLVMKRVVLSHRRSLTKGLLDKLRPDGKLGAGCNPCATPTFRANYKVVVNIPAARSVYGKQLRSLFIPDNEDHVFLGSDAAGLEARMLCHYMNDPNYTDILLNGDIHSYNQELAGLPTRDHAKTFFYAFLYGAGDANLGAQVGGGKKEGAEMRANFLNGLPKLDNLINRLTNEASSGKIVGLDGRTLHIRKGWDGLPETHKALNTLLQSAGAIVMKYGMIFLDHWVRQAQLEAHQVIWMHDEVQWSVHKKDLEEMELFANNYVRVAGEFLNMNVPLASDAMIGNNWYQTH